MHALGIIVLWTAVQVTVIAVVTLALLPFTKKSEPLWRTRIILAGLAAVLLISACGVSPWPNWSRVWESPQSAVEDTKPLKQAGSPPASPSTIATTETGVLAAGESPMTKVKNADESFSAWSVAWTEFLDQVKKPRPVAFQETRQVIVEEKPAFTVGAVIGVLFLIGVGLSLMRLLAGIWLLRREISRSPIIREERIKRVIRQILGDAAQADRITVRVSRKLQTAATTGIFRPVILLPTCWHSWSDEDLQAVLAHELNHIQCQDCLSTLVAEFVRVLHFYHPLMHWLANRLRLEQELAADAHAARVLGGQKRYLCILAEMALSESAPAPAWPARAFLPSHRTLIRRIEMLRKNPPQERHASRFWRCATMACLGLATVFAVGLRDQAGIATAQAPDTSDTPPTTLIAQADPPIESDAPTDSQPFPLTYVPDDAIAVFGVRPKDLLSKSGLQPLAQILMKEEQTSTPFGIPLGQIEQIVWSFGTEDTPNHPPMLIAGMIRSSGKLNLEMLKEWILAESDTGFYGGQLYLRNKDGSGPAFWLANERTLIISDSENGLKQAIDARNLSVNREKRIPEWEDVAGHPFASYSNIGMLRRLVESPPGGGFGTAPRTPQKAFPRNMGLNPMFAPLWNDVETLVGGVTFDEDVQAKFTAQTKDAEGALKVKQTLDAMLVLGRNMVEQNQQMIGQLPEGERNMIGMLLELSQELMKSIEIERGPKDVGVTAKLPPKAVNQLVTALVPAVTAAQDAARIAKSKSNLKQIGLAMHNYHDAYQHLPKPVMLGPDGKTPHSWRVAILPYIDETGLYEQYRFDEPWDSEHNKKLLAKMPAIYRHPKDKANSTNTSYFALTGQNTLMGDSKQNSRFRDIIDGLSYTLMIVEAKRDIPWTKPEDISYDEDRSKAPPQLGGWFKNGYIAVFGDGAVYFLSDAIEKTLLQNLIERNDGQVVNFDKFTDRPRRRERSGATQPVPAFQNVPSEGASPPEPESAEEPRDEGEDAAFDEAGGQEFVPR